MRNQVNVVTVKCGVLGINVSELMVVANGVLTRVGMELLDRRILPNGNFLFSWRGQRGLIHTATVDLENNTFKVTNVKGWEVQEVLALFLLWKLYAVIL